MAMQLDHQQLRELLEQLSKSDIQEFRLEGQDFRLEVRRNLPATVAAGVTPVVAQVVASQPSETAASTPPAPPATAASRSDLVPITAPMVGTFYRSPAPGDSPFVELGTRIKAGQTVCILEAMKLMNELEAEVAGEVVEILVENGTPVEFGQVLMRIRP